jgi:hypothetical protein
MSDRDKGLLKAEMDTIPNTYRAFCYWHIAENIKKKFGQKARYTFWKLVYVQTSGQWVSALKKFKEARGKVNVHIS